VPRDVFPISGLNELNQVVFYSFAFQQNHGADGLWAAFDTIVRLPPGDWSGVTVTAHPTQQISPQRDLKAKDWHVCFLLESMSARNTGAAPMTASDSCWRITRRASPHRYGRTVNKSYLLASRPRGVDWAVCFASQCTVRLRSTPTAAARPGHSLHPFQSPAAFSSAACYLVCSSAEMAIVRCAGRNVAGSGGANRRAPTQEQKAPQPQSQRKTNIFYCYLDEFRNLEGGSDDGS
jgi:hypothetical protein